MIKKWQVLISKSHDIYTNLAWEDWLYRKMDFTNVNLLLLWRNKPCVVIGRYQNPWKEANLSILEDAGILLARRNSGGGTVYHDLGNLNFTFLTERKLYNRRTNLEFIVKTLREKYNIPAVVSPRDDIVVREKLKISGTAAKLGRTTAYHHCTLLCNVRKDQLRAVLTPNNKGIQTNASESVPSPTVNLNEVDPSIISSDLIAVFAEEFSKLNSFSEKTSEIREVDPSDQEYPGLTSASTELKNPKFILGNTPKFNIVREFASAEVKFRMEISIEKGKIVKSKIDRIENPALTAAAETVLSAAIGFDFDSEEMWHALTVGFNIASIGDAKNVRDDKAATQDRDFVYRCIVRAFSLQE